jgi:hypothetical protein
MSAKQLTLDARIERSEMLRLGATPTRNAPLDRRALSFFKRNPDFNAEAAEKERGGRGV